MSGVNIMNAVWTYGPLLFFVALIIYGLYIFYLVFWK